MRLLLICLTIVFVVAQNDATSQIVSQFTFESDPVTTADVGPDATSISASAFSDVGGAGGTRGLNAGLPKADIDMIIPGSPTFDLNGIDVSFDYHREENAGTFWQRGNSLRIMGTSNLSVSYRVDDGMGGYNVVNSGNVYSIPNDDTYRNYRFYYTPCDGYGALLVDGVEVWSNDGPDNRNMYWTGSGNVEVGNGLDGTGNNDAFLDNVIVGEIICSPLPIELISFTASFNETNRTVDLNWVTATELDNDYFSIERSVDGILWEEINQVDGAGNSAMTIEYNEVDEHPIIGHSYYRLKQTDFDGDFEYSPIVGVNIEKADFNLYPNPVSVGESIVVQTDKETIGLITIYDLQGKQIFQKDYSNILSSQAIIKIDQRFKPGVYAVRTENKTIRLIVR